MAQFLVVRPLHTYGEDTHHLFLVARRAWGIRHSPLLPLRFVVAAARFVAVRVVRTRRVVGPSSHDARRRADPHTSICVRRLLVFLGRTRSTFHFESRPIGGCLSRVLGSRSDVARRPSH